eukprot:TRINITY_DN19995_c0_g1_i1.p1 TRINITY_DN19995_c0_g1~~TRINITY_DN19995_c0_g1_i1.p1  ORF type:complete len:468 (+),score=112.23 TRINITY_DN19995_c0_g1_i1:59-1462(+)
MPRLDRIECGGYGDWAFAVCESKGIRGSMEDVAVTEHVLAVLDGHGGRECAEFISSRLCMLADLPQEKWQEAFAELDDAFRAESKLSGSCCCVAVAREGFLQVANLGDSRAVLLRNSKVVEETVDHKPSSVSEQERITLAGGAVDFCGEGPARVAGVAVSRAFGTYKAPLGTKFKDVKLKDPQVPHANRILSCVPDLYTWKTEPGDLLVIACDGVWDVLQSADLEAVAGSDVRDRSQNICLKALPLSTDNVSCIVAELGAAVPPQQCPTATPQQELVVAARDGRPSFNSASKEEQIAIGNAVGYGETLLTMMEGLGTDFIMEGIWLGTAGDACFTPFLEYAKATRIVNCAAEIDERPEFPSTIGGSFCLRWRDSEEQGKAEQKGGFKRLQSATKFMNDALEANEVVLVHCVQGISRSATVVVAFLMEFRGFDMDDAVALVKKQHPGALKPFRFQEMLRAFQYHLKAK